MRIIFERWYFGLVLKLEISYYRVMISWRIFGFFQTIFWRLYIFLCGWNILVFVILLLPLRYLLMLIMARPRCDNPLVLFGFAHMEKIAHFWLYIFVSNLIQFVSDVWNITMCAYDEWACSIEVHVV